MRTPVYRYALMVALLMFVFWVSTQPRRSSQDAFSSPSSSPSSFSSAQPSSSLSAASVRESDLPLLHDSFPLTGAKRVSGRSVEDNWRYYPVFSEPSFAPLTNNLRYPRNPDDGQCTPAEFCGAMYHDRADPKSNEVWPLPPVPEGPGVRVGYFRTDAP